MKKTLVVFSLFCITTIGYSQEIKLKLFPNLDTLKFHLTTLKEAKKILGHPDNISTDGKHNTNLIYNRFGVELVFSKYIGNTLWCMTLSNNSPIIINDSIKLNSTDTLKLVRLLGAPYEKNRNSKYIEFEYHADTPSSADFYFNKQGILTSVILQDPIVIGVDL